MRIAAVLVAGFLGGCFSNQGPMDHLPLETPARLVLSEESLGFTAIGATAILRATVLTAEGKPLPSARVHWSSTDPAIASVDSSGLVTALSQGRAEIVASHRGIAAKAQVRVLPTPKELAGVAILPEEPTLTFLGQTIQLRALGVDEEGNHLSEILASWEVEDDSIAEVDSQGLLEAVGMGTTRVRATVLDGSISSETQLTVRPLPSTLHFLDAPSPTIAGKPQPAPIRVEARDAGGHRVATRGLSVEIAALYGEESIGLDVAPIIQGIATFEKLIVERAGAEIRLVARHESALAQSEIFSVKHAEPERLHFLEPPLPLEARVPLTLRVGITDAYGNTVPSEKADVRISLRSALPPGLQVSGDFAASTEGGVATFEFQVDGPGELLFEAAAAGWPSAEKWLRSRYLFTSLRSGGRHNCGLLRTGELLCFGANDAGQLGLPPDEIDSVAHPIPTLPGLSFREVEARKDFSCGITREGEALCWGDVPGREQYSSRPWPLPLGDETPTSIALGHDHICVLLEDGGIRCLGRNDHGQLGDGTLRASGTPVAVEAPPAVVLAAGAGFACALEADGTPWCWGRNDENQLGGASDEPYEKVPIAIEGLELVSLSLGASHACGLTSTGRAYCWGSSSLGQLGDGKPEENPPARAVESESDFIQLVAGSDHSCAIDAMGGIACWGAGADGQLGVPELDEDFTSIPLVVEPPFEGASFVQLSAGERHSCAIEAGGASFCWGMGEHGRLGTGDEGSRDRPAPVEGTQP